MKRAIFALLLSPLVVPLLILVTSGLRPNMIHFAALALPYSYALTVLIGFPVVYLIRLKIDSAPRLWMTAVAGIIIAVVFLFFLTRESLDAPDLYVYLVYSVFGGLTASLAHWIAFGIKHSGTYEKRA